MKKDQNKTPELDLNWNNNKKETKKKSCSILNPSIYSRWTSEIKLILLEQLLTL